MNIQVRDNSFDIAPFVGAARKVSSPEASRYNVQQILLDPGEKTIPHFHLHRTEHWVVVNGSARVSLGGQSFDLFEGQSVDIAIGCAHAIENHGKVPLHMVEIQMGLCLGDMDRDRVPSAP